MVYVFLDPVAWPCDGHYRTLCLWWSFKNIIVLATRWEALLWIPSLDCELSRRGTCWTYRKTHGQGANETTLQLVRISILKECIQDHPLNQSPIVLAPHESQSQSPAIFVQLPVAEASRSRPAQSHSPHTSISPDSSPNQANPTELGDFVHRELRNPSWQNYEHFIGNLYRRTECLFPHIRSFEPVWCEQPEQLGDSGTKYLLVVIVPKNLHGRRTLKCSSTIRTQ